MEIALGTFSLHREIRDGRLSLLDLVRIAPERYDIHACELLSTYFPSRDEVYLRTLRDAAAASGVRLVHLPVDGYRIAAPDPDERRKQMAEVKRWIRAGSELGIPTMRIAAGDFDPDDPAAFETVAGAYRDLTQFAGDLGITLAVENLGSLTNRGDAIVKIVNAVGADNFGTCPDWGNSAPEQRYAVLEAISPLAKIVHAKMYEFGADGEEKTIDVGRCLDMLRNAGYSGYLVIEYGGKGDQYAGVEQAVALVRRHLDAAATE